VRPALKAFALRVNVLEQCQLDCGYCRPGTAQPTPNAQRLTPAHYARLATALATLPSPTLRKVRFTGGEPLLRDDFDHIVRAFRVALPGTPLAVTTNGQRLGPRLDALARAGLTGATVHVDSLRSDRYRQLMGPGEPDAVLATVLAARGVLEQVKLNVVVQRGLNDDELGDFLEWSSRTGVEVRFIELMNTGSARAFTREHFVSRAEILSRVGARAAVVELERDHPASPAARYIAGGVRFGVISSDSTPFCEACDRLRLSPSGALRGCLYEPEGAPLGPLLLGDRPAAEIGALIRLVGLTRRSWHPSAVTHRAPFSMAQVGG